MTEEIQAAATETSTTSLFAHFYSPNFFTFKKPLSNSGCPALRMSLSILGVPPTRSLTAPKAAQSPETPGMFHGILSTATSRSCPQENEIFGGFVFELLGNICRTQGWEGLDSQEVLHVVGHLLLLLLVPQQVESHVQSQDAQVGCTQEVLHCSGERKHKITKTLQVMDREWTFLTAIMET